MLIGYIIIIGKEDGFEIVCLMFYFIESKNGINVLINSFIVY